MLVSITTPISVWFFLPFLRGKRNRDDNCYGLFSLTKNRFFGVYGAMDNRNNHHSVESCQTYGYVEREIVNSVAEKGDIKAHDDDVELM